MYPSVLGLDCTCLVRETAFSVVRCLVGSLLHYYTVDVFEHCVRARQGPNPEVRGPAVLRLVPMSTIAPTVSEEAAG